MMTMQLTKLFAKILIPSSKYIFLPTRGTGIFAPMEGLRFKSNKIVSKFATLIYEILTWISPAHWDDDIQSTQAIEPPWSAVSQ